MKWLGLLLLPSFLLADTTISLREFAGVNYPEQPFTAFYAGGKISPTNTRIMKPNGASQEPFQQLTSGLLFWRAHLPPTTVHAKYNMDGSGDVKISTDPTYPNSFSMQTAPQGGFQANQTIQYRTGGGSVTCNGSISDGALLYIKSYTFYPGVRASMTLSLTPGGSTLVLTTTACGTAPYIVFNGYTADGSADTFVTGLNYLANGDPVSFTGACPASGVTCDGSTVYYVVSRNSTSFQIAATVGGSAINIGNLTSGLNEIVINWGWVIQAGAPSFTVTNPIICDNSNATYLQCTNGLTGIRMLKASGSLDDAPIQGIQLVNGDWVATGGKLYMGLNGVKLTNFEATGANAYQLATQNTAYKLTRMELGPLITVLQGSYTATRSTFVDGSDNPLIGSGSGTGHYTVTVTLYSNQKSMLVSVASDMIYGMFLNIYPNWSDSKPDTRKFRSDAVIDESCGNFYGPLTITGATNASPIVLTITDHGLSFAANATVTGVGGNTNANVTASAYTIPDKDHITLTGTTGNGSYTSGGIFKALSTQNRLVDMTETIDYSGNIVAAGTCGAGIRQQMGVWSNQNQGGHAQWVYSGSDDSSAPIFATYTGRASQNISADLGFLGFYSSNSHWITGAQALGLLVASYPCDNGQGTCVDSPNNHYIQNQLREFGICAGCTKADITSLNPATPSPIAQEQNQVTGINLSHIYGCVYAGCSTNGYGLTYSDPPVVSNPAFMDPTDFSTLRSNFQADTLPGISTANYRISAGASASTILDMWAANDSASIDALMIPVVTTQQDAFNSFANLDGYFTPTYAGIEIDDNAARDSISMLTAIDDPNVTTLQKTNLKALLALYAAVLNDQDLYPNDTAWGGDNPGNANQVQQHINTQTFFRSTLPTQPYMATLQSTVPGRVLASVTDVHNNSGNPQTSPHYSKTFDFGVFVQLYQKYLGGADPTTIAILDRYCGAVIVNWLGPNDHRFNDGRKIQPWGDSNPEAFGQMAMCASLYKTTNPTKAAQIQAAWTSTNTATFMSLAEYFGPGAVATNLSITPSTADLISANFPGYYMASRFAVGTNNEIYCALLNGNWFSDHAHANSGQVQCYFFGVPLFSDSPSNNSFPSVSGNYIHDGVVVESGCCGGAWDADNPSITSGARYGTESNAEFLDFTYSRRMVGQSVASGAGGTWTRALTLIYADTVYPQLHIHDDFGADTTSRILTSRPIYSPGAITTPWGSQTPTARRTTCTENPSAYPSNFTAAAISSGLQHFKITSPTYAGMGFGSNGIVSNMYFTRGTSGATGGVGAWGTSCVGGREMTAYQNVNGSSFVEDHALIRIKDTGSYDQMWIVNTADQSDPSAPTNQSCGKQLVNGGKTTCQSETQMTYTDGTVKALASYDTNSHTALNLTVSGGAQEIACATSTSCIWTVTGTTAGIRTLNLASFGGTWYADKPIVSGGTNIFTLYHPGADAVTGRPPVYTINLSTTAGTQASMVVQSYSASGSLYLKAGSEFVGKVSSSGQATITTVTPSSHGAFSLCIDVNGLVCEN